MIQKVRIQVFCSSEDLEVRKRDSEEERGKGMSRSRGKGERGKVTQERG